MVLAAEPIVKSLSQPFFLSVNHRYHFACTIRPVFKTAVTPNHKIKFYQSVDGKSVSRGNS